MAPYWMRLSPEQAIGWYCVPKETAHQPQHTFYGLNLTEEDMQSGWWMTDRAFFAVLSSPEFSQGLRLHTATIDGDSFGTDEGFNVLDPGYKMGIGVRHPGTTLELAEILLQRTTPPSQSISPTMLTQVSHAELAAKASRFKFDGLRRKEEGNHYYQVLTGESDQDEQFVRLAYELGFYISFYRLKFDRQLFYQTSYLDVSEQALWEFAKLIKSYG